MCYVYHNEKLTTIFLCILFLKETFFLTFKFRNKFSWILWSRYFRSGDKSDAVTFMPFCVFSCWHSAQVRPVRTPTCTGLFFWQGDVSLLCMVPASSHPCLSGLWRVTSQPCASLPANERSALWRSSSKCVFGVPIPTGNTRWEVTPPHPVGVPWTSLLTCVPSHWPIHLTTCHA